MKKIILVAVVFFFAFTSVSFAQLEQEIDKWTRKVEKIYQTGKKAVETYEDGQKTVGRLTGKKAEIRIQNGYSGYSNRWLAIETKSGSEKVFRKDTNNYIPPGDDVSIETKVFPDQSTVIYVTFKIVEFDEERNAFVFIGSWKEEFRLSWDRRNEDYIADRTIRPK